MIEHLATDRLKASKKLSRVILRERKPALRLLKRRAEAFKRARKNSKKQEKVFIEVGKDVSARMLELSAALKSWPDLNAHNLHAFRLLVKEIRYLLQIGKRSDPEFLAALGKAKDSIGEWHDWTELEAIA